MNTKIYLVLLAFIAWVCSIRIVQGDKILFVGAIISGSHLLTIRKLARELANAGHQVKILRWKEIGHPKGEANHPNLTEIEMTLNNTDGNLALISKEEHAGFEYRGKDMWNFGMTFRLLPFDGLLTIRHACNQMLGDAKLQDELQRDNFSIAVVDLLFNECGLALTYKLGIPSVGFWAFHFGSGPSLFTPAFNPPSSTPQVMAHLEIPMNILQRTLNTFYFIVYILFYQVRFVLTYSAIRFHVPDCPYPSTLYSNLSGALINSNPSINPPLLLPPTYVEVGGMHLSEPKKLPKDIEDFIESSGPSGVIIFALGTIFDPESISNDYFEAYFEVFGRFQEKVIVKSRRLPSNLPKNVLVKSFLPQQDILAHNKTRLFITHCGMHSIVESVHHEVPMVGIPIFLDQKDNLLLLIQHGVAKGLERDSNPEEIFSAINGVLTDTSYKNNIKDLKKQMAYHGDPLKKALGLLDHVMMTKGAEGLKLNSRHLNIFQYLCIDVLLCIGIMAWLSYVILFKWPRHMLIKVRENYVL